MTGPGLFASSDDHCRAIAREFPGWRVWQSPVNRLWHARLGGAKVVLVHAESPEDLRERIRRQVAAPGVTSAPPGEAQTGNAITDSGQQLAGSGAAGPGVPAELAPYAQRWQISIHPAGLRICTASRIEDRTQRHIVAPTAAGLAAKLARAEREEAGDGH